MARLTGVFAANHGPLMAREWEKVDEARRAQVTAAFAEIGRRISAARTDVLIVVSPDHWVNFFIDNLPSICIGVGERHGGPPEPWLKDFPHRDIAGHPGLALHIVEQALAGQFEPSVSHCLKLDHGFCIPLWKMGLAPLPAIIPLIVNDIEPPLPSVHRCYAWGRLLDRAISGYPEDLSVAVLATGGMSHSIGEPTMGRVDERFDRECITHFESGNTEALLDFLERRMTVTGNGTEEMRNWVVAHGAAGGRGFETIYYRPIPEWYVGCGFAAWNVSGAARPDPGRALRA